VLPPELSALFGAADPAARDAAWRRFVEAHSRLVLYAARSIDRSHDAAMDAYAYVLEQLQRDDFRRLRAYAADDRGKFSTWLVLVARRLCLDRVRQRYGRRQSGDEQSHEAHETRRRLLDHVAEEVDVAEIANEGERDAEMRVRAEQLRDALAGVLATLAPPDRLLIKLRFQDALSVPEIARILQAPTPFHIYRRLNAVLAQVRAALARRGVEDPNP
jgi:RNA polymerase sigma factor (sigma-70 family)